VWKAVCCVTDPNTGDQVPSEEIAFWSVTGQKLGTYRLSASAGQVSPQLIQPTFTASQTTTNYYFGGKLIKNANGHVGADRFWSIGKYYPYGQEKPSAATNGTEKFTGYFRDAETGLDYAENRYYQSGMGRFLTPDPYADNWDPANPSSWNMYSYVNGDPINENDPDGLKCSDVALAGWAGIPTGTKVGAFLSQSSDLSIFAETVLTEARIGLDDNAAYEKAAISA
jgi:RHS repeat-associated protein